MRIENEMLSRFKSIDSSLLGLEESTISNELEFFFGNVFDTVVEYFTEKEMLKA